MPRAKVDAPQRCTAPALLLLHRPTCRMICCAAQQHACQTLAATGLYLHCSAQLCFRPPPYTHMGAPPRAPAASAALQAGGASHPKAADLASPRTPAQAQAGRVALSAVLDRSAALVLPRGSIPPWISSPFCGRVRWSESSINQSGAVG